METEYEDRGNLTGDSKEDLLIGIGEYWGCFYLANPHRFAMDYLKYKLHIFQQILLYFMMKSDQFVFIASRGLGKSFLTAVFCTVICILKPGTKVIVCAKQKKQAEKVLTEKILGILYPQSYALRKEIDYKGIKCNSNQVLIPFKNGSSIEVLASSENSRGARCNVLVMDEFRMINETIVRSVLSPFGAVPRQAGYLTNPRYSFYREENKELYLSSAWYSDHWSYSKWKTTVKDMLTKFDSFACNIPFTCSLEHGLNTKKKMEREMDAEGMNYASFLMEYCAVFFNEADDAFFKSSIINPCRDTLDVFYPPTAEEWIAERKKKKSEQSWYMPRVNGEIRIMACDIALAKGVANDNSSFLLMRMIPDRGKFKRHVVYMEAHNGMAAKQQAIRIKQLFYDFGADKLIIDTTGVGEAVWEFVRESNYDEERGVRYDGFTCFNEDNRVDDLSKRTGLPFVYSMQPNSEVNSRIAVSVRKLLADKDLILPMNDREAKILVTEKVASLDLDLEEAAYREARYLAPFVQTTIMVNEMISLNHESKEGKIKLFERGANRKDRYSSLGYAVFLSNLIAQEEGFGVDDDDILFFV